jgi:O-antigen/teichoic acid export membrane protein
MKFLINNIFHKIGIISERTNIIAKHISFSFFYKGGSIIINFLIVPLTMNLLDIENYGIWLTISSFISWFSFFDIGLDHGFRNKFSEAVTKGDTRIAKAYVSTAYITIGTFCFLLLVSFLIINKYINWPIIFNVIAYKQSDLRVLMLIISSFFCLQLVLKLITTIYLADQQHSVQGKITFYISLISLISILFISNLFKGSLLLFGTIFSAAPVLILTVVTIYSFTNKYKKYSPSFKLFNFNYLRDIFELGYKFFLIQLSGILLFSTDNFIITQLFGPKEVVPFMMAFKYFSLSNMLLTIILTPYWSSITNAYILGDFIWIKTSMKNLIKISYFSIFILFLMLCISPLVYKIWLGDKILIDSALSIFISIYFALTMLYLPYTYFINGVGKVKLQMFTIGIAALINIPLSIFFAKKVGMGVSGITFATILCIIPHCIVCRIQYKKIINNEAFGIFNS